MTITCKPESMTEEGVSLGVKISVNKEIKTLSEPIKDTYEAMEILSILRYIKEYNIDAFHIAMEHFIEEELKNE